MYFTIFTPTYNRAYILERAYESLLAQTCKDFLWLIIDDGSQDNTEELVSQWIEEGKIAIKYVKQENMGRFGAYNTATKFFTGELFSFLDSDDAYMPNMLEEIKKEWEKRDKNLKVPIIGIIFYMQYPNGEIIGNQLPNIYSERLYVLKDRYGLKGDKAQVYDRKVIQQYKYPIFPGEKYIGDSLIMNRANEKGQMLVFPQALYIREYLPDSLSSNRLKVRCASPKGTAYYYKETMKYYNYNFVKKTVYAMKYIAFSIIGKTKIFDDIHGIQKLLVVIMYIPGILYCLWMKFQLNMKN